MAKRAASKAAKASEPIVFPKGTPDWKKIRCGLCGAEPKFDCRDLARATDLRLKHTHEGKAIKTEPPKLKEPHAVRVAAARSMFNET